MHDEVSETENLRKNLAVERMIVEGCDILLDVNQVFVRQGKLCTRFTQLLRFMIMNHMYIYVTIHILSDMLAFSLYQIEQSSIKV